MNIITDENNFPKSMIKKLTPFLDNIIIPGKNGKTKPKKLTDVHRAFAWYYVHGRFNKAEAWRKATRGRYNPHTGKIECADRKKQKGKTETPDSMLDAIEGNILYNYLYIQQAIRSISENYMSDLKLNVPQSMIEQLQIQATYDPAMFINSDGSPKFQSWDEIPFEYRCCVENIESRYYGKDADRKVTIIKLVDRDKARKYLLQLCPDLLSPDRLKVIHTTIDEDGNEIGINELPKMSEKELQEKLKKLEEKG